MPLRLALEWFARHGGVLLAAGIFAGLLTPPLAAAMRDVVTPSVAGLTTLVLLRIDPAQVLGYLRRPVLVTALLAWVLLASPVLAFAVARLTGLDPALAAGLVIMATGPAAISSPAFARMVGLDGEVSLVVAVLSTLLVPFTAPPLALGLLGIDLSISVPALMGRLALLVGMPLALAVLIRRMTPPVVLDRWGKAVDGTVVLLVVIFGFGIMDGVLARLLAAPGFVLGGAALAFGGSFALNAAAALAFRAAGQPLGLTAGLLSGNRNTALFFAVLPAATDPKILLFFALCQFPLFLTPFLLRPFYRRLNRKDPGRTIG
ncbi:bile acid:sodium symporter family protein [Roseomonas chloroacetimidivorans]|uniref:bile acid:sodium symporter family protein n=1 Tax=Roseomonas chloroacetimidivorans TaxID=1766656 RepID=UPI003C7756E7